MRRSRREQPNKVIGQLQILNCPHNHAKKAKLLACLLFFLSLSKARSLQIYTARSSGQFLDFNILFLKIYVQFIFFICIFNIVL